MSRNLYAIVPDGGGRGIEWGDVIMYDEISVASHRLVFLALHKIKRLLRDGVSFDELTVPRYSNHRIEEYSMDTNHMFVNMNSYRIDDIHSILKQWHSQNLGLTLLQVVEYAFVHTDMLIQCVKLVC